MQWFHIVSASIVFVMFVEKRSCAAVSDNESVQSADIQTALNSSSDQYDKNSVTETIEFWNQHIRRIKFAKRKDFILMVGDDDSEKTALTLFLIENDLIVIETEPFKFIYRDRNDLINKFQKNIFPELITDDKSGLEYYIFPSWNLTTDAKHEISTLFFAQRILNFADNVKLVFVINHRWFPPIHSESNKRRYLREFITNATMWMTNIRNIPLNYYSLVVTNLETEHNDTNDIINVSIVLENLYEDLTIENGKPNTSDKQKRINVNNMKFINALLEEVSGRFTRIAILREGNQTGSVYDMPLLQSERIKISEHIRNFTQYISKDKVGFDFPISNQTYQQIPELIKEIQTFLANDIAKIISSIDDFFWQKEKQHLDVKILIEIMYTGYIYISEVNSVELVDFSKQLLNAANKLKIHLISDLSKNLFNHIEFHNYLVAKCNNKTQSKLSFNVSSSINRTKTYLRESQTWYAFIFAMNLILSKYSIQKDIELYSADVSKLMAEFSIGEFEEKNLDDTQLRQFLKRIDSDIYKLVENMTINSLKMNAMKSLLNQTMKGYIKYECSKEKMTIFGYYIKLSDIFSIPCVKRVRFIEVFALNAVFIDADIDKTGEKAQITIVATIWHIIGVRKFILNGKPGEPYASQNSGSTNGNNGKPGNPGGTAGNFIGIGETFINDKNLEIHVNGGKGGPGETGQHGTG